MVEPPLETLLKEIRACRHCEAHLPLGPRPVLIANPKARILIAGQAPGKAVHQTGIPWNDISGRRLRQFLEIDEHTFYHSDKIAIIPMGFCYPGTGPSGDNPPRPECRQLWHARLFTLLPHLELRIVIGQYAQNYHLAGRTRKTLTDTVAAWREFAPEIYPMPHPSPRNQMWFRRNPWFAEELLPSLKARIREILASP